MILLTILTIFAMMVLAFGFLEIRIPFISGKKESRPEEVPASDPHLHTDKLVKNSIENTIRSTTFLKPIIKEKVLVEELD